MNTDIEELCRRIISAIFDGGSRGLLIVAVVWVTLKLFRQANAATRHGAWFATLLILAGLPIVEFFNLRPAPAAIESTELSASPTENFLPFTAVEIQEPLEDLPTVELQPAETIAEPIPQPSRISLPQYVGMILVGGWLALAAVRLIGLLCQLVLLNGITQRALSAPADLKAICGSISREMKLRRKVRLLFSSEVSAPMVVGFLNPTVLVPKSIAAETQIEPVLRHELAHVARWDDWANLIQQFIKAVLFFHPGISLASSRLTAEREIACDDHALAALAAPQDYALFLTEFASRMRGRDYAAAPAAWSRNSQLKERIVMILDGKRNASPRLDRTRLGTVTAGALTLAVMTLAAGPRVTFAENEKPKADVVVDSKVVATVGAQVEPVIVATPSVSATVPAVAISAAPADIVPVADSPRPPRAPRNPGGGDNLERRLERLERMVESLMSGEKMTIKPDWNGPMAMPMPKPAPMPPDHFHKDFEKNFHKEFKLDFDHEKFAKKAGEDVKREMDRARVELDRAKREMERGKREGEWARERAELERERADKQRGQAERQRDQADRQRDQAERQREQGAQGSPQDRRSLERERQSLEEQRRSIEKRIESIEKQMQKRNSENQNSDSNSNKSSDSGPKEKF